MLDQSNGVRNSKGQKDLKQMGKARKLSEAVLAALEEGDKEVRPNPHSMQIAKGKENFADIFEASLKENDFNPGDVVTGAVIEVQSDYVLVDIKYKSEGLIPIEEFRTIDGKPNV